MSNLAKFLQGLEKLSGQQNYHKWSLEVKSAAELCDAWEAMIGEDTAVSESTEHQRDLKKRARRAHGMITGSVSDSLLVELDELKGNEVTVTTGTGEDQVTSTYFAEPTVDQLWSYLKERFQKKDGTSAILDFQQMVSTRFHSDDALENQLSAIQVQIGRAHV